MHSIPTIKHLNRRKKLNDEEREKSDDLFAAGFIVQTEYESTQDEFLFHTTSPEGKQIGPMNDREVFWMLEGWKAAKHGKL